MISPVRRGGNRPLMALVVALGGWMSLGPSKGAFGGWYKKMNGPYQTGGKGHREPVGPGQGTLGYGPPGIFPGFQGFGLGYHLGYGYGGDGLGVGADGGYPYYGGPGYPHPGPSLRRCGGITHFPFYGGPGYPTPGCPNYFGGVGPLVADQPVITIASDPGEAGYGSGFGPFTGALPYPESAFAPFTAEAAATGSTPSTNPSTPSSSTPNPTPPVVPSD